MPRKTWSRLLAVPCLLTLALLAGAGKAAAQSCCDPDPCGPADVCTQVWHFGPDGEPYCEARCSPALNQCNHDGHCDEPQENQSNCWDDCHPCVPTETCEGRCGNIDDGCGHTLHCGSCAPPCNHD